MAIFVLTLHVRKIGKCHRDAWKAHWQFPDVTRPELKVRGRPIFFLTLHVGKTGSGETEQGRTKREREATKREREVAKRGREAAKRGSIDAFADAGVHPTAGLK